MSLVNFPIQPELTQIAVNYRNRELIADEILPYTPVGVQSFKYSKWDKAEAFTVPNTLVGRKSTANEVEFTATEETASTRDYALDVFIPQSDLENAGSLDIRGKNVEKLTDLILLDRENRVANLVFNTNTYAANNRKALSGTDQFNDFTNSNPISVILDAAESCFVRPNTIVLGQAVWNTIRQHPKVVNAIKGNVTNAGIVSRQEFAELLEMKKVLVGASYINSANKGQTASFSRVWGKSIALAYVNPLAGKDDMTFGITARFGDRVAAEFVEPKRGLKGGISIRVGESVKELVLANDLGYLITTAVA